VARGRPTGGVGERAGGAERGQALEQTLWRGQPEQQELRAAPGGSANGGQQQQRAGACARVELRRRQASRCGRVGLGESASDGSAQGFFSCGKQ
jgi:hypothetical protein